MTDLQNLLIIMSNGLDPFSVRTNETESNSYIDIKIDDDGSHGSIALRAVFDKKGCFEYFNGASHD